MHRILEKKSQAVAKIKEMNDIAEAPVRHYYVNSPSVYYGLVLFAINFVDFSVRSKSIH